MGKYTPEHYEQYIKPWQAKNKHRLQKYRKDADLYKKYGIRLEDYNRMLTEQSAKCAICSQPETQLHHKTGLPYQLSVDHSHKTEQVRALLCNRCNRTLGMVDDDIQLLKDMITYLEKYK